MTGIHECRFLIVGAGITGLTLAYFLLEEGVPGSDIAIVEAEYAGAGSTGRSAGILIPEIETEKNVGWDIFMNRYGLKLTKEYRRAYLNALHSVEKVIKEGNIACDAQKGDFLILARNKEARERVRADIAARRRMGERPQSLRGLHLKHEFGSPGYVFAERDVEGLSVNPLALAQGIARYLRTRGVRVFEKSPLVSTYRNTARFAHGAISYKHIVYARGTAEKHSRLHKYITTIAITEKLSKEKLAELRLADLDMFIDEEGVRSFHYGKITGDGRLLLGYGDVKVEVSSAEATLHEPHLRNIKTFLKTMFPSTTLSVDYAWSGAYAIRTNLVPIVAVTKHGLVVNGAGIQLGSVASAHYAAAVLLGKKHPLHKLWND